MDVILALQALAGGATDWLEVSVAVHTNTTSSHDGMSTAQAVESQLKVFQELEDASTQVGVGPNKTQHCMCYAD